MNNNTEAHVIKIRGTSKEIDSLSNAYKPSKTPFPNLGDGPYEGEARDIIRKELESAGLQVVDFEGIPVAGFISKWTFKRAWRYYIAEGPGIPLDAAMELDRTHGNVVRADGDCACRGPLFWNKGFGTGMYHVDTVEGLNALISVVRNISDSTYSIFVSRLTNVLEAALKDYYREWAQNLETSFNPREIIESNEFLNKNYSISFDVDEELPRSYRTVIIDFGENATFSLKVAV